MSVDYSRRPKITEGPIQEDWIEHGSCVGANVRLWFPGRGGDDRPAKKICAGCPVRQACLDYSVEHNEIWGVWGGLNETERRRLRMERRGAA